MSINERTRFEVLEKKVRHMFYLVVVLASFGVCVFLLGVASPGQGSEQWITALGITTQAINFVDEQGRERGSIMTSGSLVILNLLNEQGEQVISLSGADGATILSLTRGSKVMTFGITEDNNMIILADGSYPKGKVSISAGDDYSDAAGISIGDGLLHLTAKQSAGGSIIVSDRNGKAGIGLYFNEGNKPQIVY